MTTSVRKHAAKMKNAFTKPEEAVEVRWKTTDTEKENAKNNHERESTQKVACVAQTDCQGSGRAGRTNQDRTCRPRVGAKVTEARGEEATQAWEIQKSSSSSIALRPLQQEGKKVSRHSPCSSTREDPAYHHDPFRLPLKSDWVPDSLRHVCI